MKNIHRRYDERDQIDCDIEIHKYDKEDTMIYEKDKL